jgi:lambda repressor-like predicted transcriptional regulator
VRADPAVSPLAGQAHREYGPIVGVLGDGTPYFAPLGQVVVDGTRVTCHLCGRTFRSVAAHLASHGWTKAQYCEAFGLERTQSLEGADTRKLRAAAFGARLVFEPALRKGSAHGRRRAVSGQLTRQAADAARGRPFPEQRRQRQRAAVSAAARAQLAQANRERADQHLAAVAQAVATRAGYADIGQLVTDMAQAGHSLAAISRACGLDKDWLQRHLPRLDPVVAVAAIRRGDDRLDAHWLAPLKTMGFPDVASYLRQRHLVEHMSVNAIAAEVGLSFHTVKSALARHGLAVTAHAAKRYGAQRRAAEVAADLGVDSITEFIDRSRAEGWTWQKMAAASGQPETWLRRHAAKAAGTPPDLLLPS